MVMTLKECPGFVTSNHIAALPFFGYVAKAIGSLFVERSEKGSRDNMVPFAQK